jgi:hypothetical protein
VKTGQENLKRTPERKRSAGVKNNINKGFIGFLLTDFPARSKESPEITTSSGRRI